MVNQSQNQAMENPTLVRRNRWDASWRYPSIVKIISSTESLPTARPRRSQAGDLLFHQVANLHAESPPRKIADASSYGRTLTRIYLLPMSNEEGAEPRIAAQTTVAEGAKYRRTHNPLKARQNQRLLPTAAGLTSTNPNHHVCSFLLEANS